MTRTLSNYLQEGEVISHTCYGNTYRAIYNKGLLVDEIDPGLVFTSPTAFANTHLEKGKANGWDKCKVERGGSHIWLKDLPIIAPATVKSDVVIPTTKKLKLRTATDIKHALTTQTMPVTAAPAPVPVAAPVAKPKKKPASTVATATVKKPRTTVSVAGATVTIPSPLPSVICAKFVEGTDGMLDVCSTQLIVLDYFKYDGVLYYKEESTHEVFEICTDKSIGPCIGIWDSEDAVLKAPYVECNNDEYE
jgi:hypothetical protein